MNRGRALPLTDQSDPYVDYSDLIFSHTGERRIHSSSISTQFFNFTLYKLLYFSDKNTGTSSLS